MKLNRRPCFYLLLMCFWSASLLASVTVQVEPTEIKPDETFRLILSIENANSNALPNLTPLQKDFRIVATEQSMHYTLINGQAQSMKQWVILLVPKKEGTVSIPAIQIGQEQSKETHIHVLSNAKASTPDSNAHPSHDSEVMLTTEISSPNPYVGQQITYTVKLYNRGRLLDTDYQPPKAENALLIPLGGTDRYRTTANGRAYVVEEQRYAIFPQKSGPLSITGPSFHALIYDVMPRHINKHAKAMKLNVKPIPKAFEHRPWLPAESVSLTETYDDDKPRMLQGQTLVRTITIKAKALPAQLLPNLTFDDQQTFNAYPEKPDVDNQIQHNELIGKTTTKITYLLNTPGSVTIPEIKLPWFNTETGQEAIATLPARTIQVDPKTPFTGSTSSDAQQTTPPEKEQTITPPLNAPKPSILPALSWWIAAFFALAWVLTLLIWYYYAKKSGKTSRHAILKRLRAACRQNNPHAARDALLQWAKYQWPEAECFNLNTLAARLYDARFKRELQILSEHLYSLDKTPWQGQTLWQCVARYKNNGALHPHRNSGLPPLNPK